MSLEVVILAAGKGTRMRSDLPKVLHVLGARPLLAHVVDTARSLDADAVHVVYGHGGEQVPERLRDLEVRWVAQRPQLGTGHAVAQALEHVGAGARVLVMYGDVPLVRGETLRPLVTENPQGLSLLTVELDDPAGYGRVVRDAGGKVSGIVEHKDATASELAMREINTGFLAAPREALAAWLGRLRNDNVQREYYLTDVVSMAVADGGSVADCRAGHAWEVLGVNSKAELARVERLYQQQRAEELLEQGVTLRDPSRVDVRGECRAGSDCELDVNVVLEGRVTLGDRVKVGPNTWIRDSDIGSDVTIAPNCVIDGARISSGCLIGPYARLRPQTELAENVCVGNFVEIKKSSMGKGSKANHLSYVGDATVGVDVNIGAGVITCNYDGASKHRTVIGDDAFIGSDSQLVAPVEIGRGATVGAGSTVTRNAPPESLTVSRSPQRSIRGWRRARKPKA